MKNPFWTKNTYFNRNEATGLSVGVLVVAVVVLFFWGINGLFGLACSNKADLYGLDHNYRWITGCNVLVDGQYRDIENVRVFVETP